jgi:hypothetical protein
LEVIELAVDVDGGDFDPSMRRDMATRYAWQIPKDIPFSRTLDGWRDDAWELRFQRPAVLRDGVEVPYPRGRKPGQTSDEEVAKRDAARRSGALLVLGGHTHRYAYRTLEMEFAISPAMAKRLTDGLLREAVQMMVDLYMTSLRDRAAAWGTELPPDQLADIEAIVRTHIPAAVRLWRTGRRDKAIFAPAVYAVHRYLAQKYNISETEINEHKKRDSPD